MRLVWGAWRLHWDVLNPQTLHNPYINQVWGKESFREEIVGGVERGWPSNLGVILGLYGDNVEYMGIIGSCIGTIGCG